MSESKKTEWLGLWRTRQGVYLGQTFKKSDIPAYARLIVRNNKFYHRDSNLPKYIYCFAQGDSVRAITVDTKVEEFIRCEELEELSHMRCFTDSQLQRLINIVACAAGGESEYGEHIISDFVTGYGADTELL